VKILVTGSDGYIGSRLVKKLRKYNSVVTYDKDKDVLDYERLASHMIDCDRVVHLAALVDYIDSVQHPGQYLEVNMMGTVNVIRAAQQLGVRLVYATTQAALSPMDNPYALSKWASEELIRKEMSNYYILRFYNIYGGEHELSRKIVPTFINKIALFKEVEIMGDGKKDYTYITDAVNALSRAVEYTKAGSYEMGTKVGTTPEELANKIGTLLGKSPKLR